MDVYNKVLYCNVIYRMWSGKKSIWSRNGGYAVIYVVKPENLYPFVATRQRVTRLLARLGLPMMGGCLIPEDDLEDFTAALKSEQAIVDRTIRAFTNNYKKLVEGAAAANPKFAQQIMEGAPSVDRIPHMFGMTWEFFRLHPIDHATGDAVTEVMVGQVVEAMDNLCTKTIHKQKPVGIKNIRGLGNVYHKLEAVKDCNRAFLGLYRIMNAIIENWVPEKTEIYTPVFLALADSDKVWDMADIAANGGDIVTILDALEGKETAMLAAMTLPKIDGASFGGADLGLIV